MSIPIGDGQMSSRSWLTGRVASKRGHIARPALPTITTVVTVPPVVDSTKPPRHTMPVGSISATMSLEQTFIDRADLVE
jgi:hypothetical protein